MLQDAVNRIQELEPGTALTVYCRESGERREYVTA